MKSHESSWGLFFRDFWVTWTDAVFGFPPIKKLSGGKRGRLILLTYSY